MRSEDCKNTLKFLSFAENGYEIHDEIAIPAQKKKNSI